MQEKSDLRMHRVAITTLVTLLLLFSVVGSVFVTSSQTIMKSIVVTPARNSTIAQYQTSEPLFIANNEDFALLGATGAGTPPDPYVFENLEISSPSESCIFVANTDAYFVINDCRLETICDILSEC